MSGPIASSELRTDRFARICRAEQVGVFGELLAYGAQYDNALEEADYW